MGCPLKTKVRNFFIFLRSIGFSFPGWVCVWSSGFLLALLALHLCNRCKCSICTCCKWAQACPLTCCLTALSTGMLVLLRLPVLLLGSCFSLVLPWFVALCKRLHITSASRILCLSTHRHSQTCPVLPGLAHQLTCQASSTTASAPSTSGFPISFLAIFSDFCSEICKPLLSGVLH